METFKEFTNREELNETKIRVRVPNYNRLLNDTKTELNNRLVNLEKQYKKNASNDIVFSALLTVAALSQIDD